jgi:putative spermidine/putrescine transport system substrate-binding protein
VGIVNSPTIGLFDLALAVESAGLMSFENMAQMSVEEIDQLFAIARDFKKRGHFCGFWTSFPQSVDFITSGRMWLGSLFSPAVASAKSLGIPISYAAPKEGYRAWHGAMCVSSECSGDVLDAAYRYMDWWLSGWPGAYIARQGYYVPNPERSRPILSKSEWDYWYEGLPAAEPLQGTDGRISVRAGETRPGGSYTRRMSNIAVWNTAMNNYEYTLQRWYELLLA